ncbi:Phosphotransferase enzyme family protein [Paenibacillus sp. RU4T]|nr:Phosphotransferase enzyme family protein [Paenibacillus sp. RU4X]SIQ75080.1 Phosphotransferase enzyme family protein [Paenibacillus sp. RU4T]
MQDMTTTIYFSSNKLGDVTSEQLQKALDRFALGRLRGCRRTASGAGGQTLFLESDGGEFVLKGNPLYEGQLNEERHFATGLLQRGLPVPAPYRLDERTDIFGWPYAVMPRLPGIHPRDLALEDEESLRKLSCLLADTLHRMHEWKSESSGEWIPASGEVEPFPGSYREWLYSRIRRWLRDAENYAPVAAEDWAWAEDILDAATDSFDRFDRPVYVMGDFKFDNLLVRRNGDRWELSGLFDFTNGYFGDGAADLPKVATQFIDRGRSDLAERFVLAYRDGLDDVEGFDQRIKVHMLHQKVLDWGCFHAIGAVSWNPEWTFREWASRYIRR